MEQSKMTEAFQIALHDPKTIKLVAELTAKNLIKLKSTPSSDEGGLVKKHIVFATAEQDGDFMTVKQVTEKLLEINDSFAIRPRVMGKALIEDVVEMKNGRSGKEYKIAAIMADISEFKAVVSDENPDQTSMEFPPEEEVFDDKKSETEKTKEKVLSRIPDSKRIAAVGDVEDIQDVAQQKEEKAAKNEEKQAKKDKKSKKDKKKKKKSKKD